MVGSLRPVQAQAGARQEPAMPQILQGPGTK